MNVRSSSVADTIELEDGLVVVLVGEVAGETGDSTLGEEGAALSLSLLENSHLEKEKQKRKHANELGKSQA